MELSVEKEYCGRRKSIINLHVEEVIERGEYSFVIFVVG
jgi:hypothetical protein